MAEEAGVNPEQHQRAWHPHELNEFPRRNAPVTTRSQ